MCSLRPPPAAALQLYSEQYGQKTPFTAALRAALEARPGLSLCWPPWTRPPARSPSTRRTKRRWNSFWARSLRFAHPVEQYYRCRFSYFLQYVLHILPRRRQSFLPLESGSLVHYILEHALAARAHALPS